MYMNDAVRHKRFTPRGGFARLVEAAGPLPRDDIVRLCWMLWWGSYTSVLAALDLAVLTLIEHPGTAAFLQKHTSSWIEEALRYRSPHVINSANLTTRREMTIGTITVAPRTPVRFLIAAINRDEDAFPDAGSFRPARPRTEHHLAFGAGVHTCVAAQLARMELDCALTALTTRLPHLTLAGQPDWRPFTTQRLCRSFPVALA